jgi:hypothetical protein
LVLDGGADPPHGVGGEPDAAVRVEAADGVDQAERALLHEVAHGQAGAAVSACDLDDDPQVACDQAAPGVDVAGFGAARQVLLFLAAKHQLARSLVEQARPGIGSWIRHLSRHRRPLPGASERPGCTGQA